jgi:hypothetical protein
MKILIFIALWALFSLVVVLGATALGVLLELIFDWWRGITNKL